MRRRHHLRHGGYESRMGFAVHPELDARIGAEVSRPEHEAGDALHGGDLVEVLDALDALDLRDDADVVVGVSHVERVVRVQRGVRDARGECPGTERALADRSCRGWSSPLATPSAPTSNLVHTVVTSLTIVDLADLIFYVLGALGVGNDDAGCPCIQRSRQADLVMLGDSDNNK